MLITFQVITENPISFYLLVEQVNPKIKILFTKLSKRILQFVWLGDICLFSFQLPAHYGLVWTERGKLQELFCCLYNAHTKLYQFF